METAKPEKRKRRDYTPEEKAEILKKYAASGLGASEGARALGLHPTVLRRWRVAAAAGKKLTSKSQYTEKQKIMFVVRFKKMGVPLEAAARKLGIDDSSLHRWVERFDTAKLRKPNAPVATLSHSLVGGSNVATADKLAALKKLKSGAATAKTLAQEYKVHPSSIQNWWKKYNPGKPWPKQKYDVLGRRISAEQRGPGKKTLIRRQILAAIPQADEPQETNGGAGKARHDALIFLRHARDAATQAIKAGAVQSDDPLVLYSMLALNALSK